jgi:L-asparagine transporter-like permease
MRGENFIYFSTVSGFFIGIIFAIIKEFDVIEFIFATIIITLIFYLITLASVAFFIKFLDIKKMVFLNKKEIDSILDSQIKELEKKENFILESYEFIRQIEQEELEIIRKNKK